MEICTFLRGQSTLSLPRELSWSHTIWYLFMDRIGSVWLFVCGPKNWNCLFSGYSRFFEWFFCYQPVPTKSWTTIPSLNPIYIFAEINLISHRTFFTVADRFREIKLFRCFFSFFAPLYLIRIIIFIEIKESTSRWYVRFVTALTQPETLERNRRKER